MWGQDKKHRLREREKDAKREKEKEVKRVYIIWCVSVVTKKKTHTTTQYY